MRAEIRRKENGMREEIEQREARIHEELKRIREQKRLKK